MKSKYKLIAASSAIILSAMAINAKIFKISQKIDFRPSDNYSGLSFSNHIYNWKFGKISYTTVGEGSPVLLIHSLFPGASVSEWSENIASLSKNNKLYLINLLGYGDSERAEISYSSYIYVCLINDFITDVIKKPAAVISSNSSAAIALMSYIFNPDNFKKLCLISPPIISEKNKFPDIMKLMPVDFPIIGDLFFNYFNSKKKIKSYLKSVYSDSCITDKKINGLYACSHKGGCSNRYLFSSFVKDYFSIGIETSLSETHIPVLIICGNLIDNKEKYIEKIKNINPSVNIELLKGKNFPNEESSEEFNNICSSFIK